MSKSTKIIQIHPITLQIIKIYDSANKANKYTNINISNILDVCKGIRVQAGGYYWRYYDIYFKELNNNQFINCYPSSNNLFNNSFICNPFYLTNNMNGYINPCINLLQNEEFKNIKGFENRYKISNFGRVISLRYLPYVSFINFIISDDGYYRVGLYDKDLNNKLYSVARLVAQTFIPNPNNLPQVNHKDEIKTNNFYENLEWCTNKYNMNYGTRNKRASESKFKPVNQIDKDTGKIINTFISIMEAGKMTGICPESISRVCLNRYRYKTAGGFKWEYV